MMSFLKLFLFLTLAACVIVAGYMAYRYFNQKIIGSRSLLPLLLHTFLLLACCVAIFLAGCWGLLVVYDLLVDQ